MLDSRLEFTGCLHATCRLCSPATRQFPSPSVRFFFFYICLFIYLSTTRACVCVCACVYSVYVFCSRPNNQSWSWSFNPASLCVCVFVCVLCLCVRVCILLLLFLSGRHVLCVSLCVASWIYVFPSIARVFSWPSSCRHRFWSVDNNHTTAAQRHDIF